MTFTADSCTPYSLCGDDVEELNNWLAQVRAYAPLAQPTAYRLAAILNGKKGATVIDLTDRVKAELGPDSAAWNDDLDRLYREGLIAMWRCIAGPTPIILLSTSKILRKPEPTPS
jgi:hypothetical protein